MSDKIEMQGNASEDPENIQINEIQYATPAPEIAPVAPGNENIVILTDHQRDLVGNHLTIAVTAEHGARLGSIKAYLDQMQILDEVLHNHPLTYRTALRQQGGASPGMQHTLRVVAISDKGTQETSEDSWQDE